MTEKIVLRSDEVAVTDRLLGYMRLSERPGVRAALMHMEPVSECYIVTRIHRETIYAVRSSSSSLDDEKPFGPSTDTRLWMVAVRGLARFIPAYPSRCPICGGRAYVGLHEVRHEATGSCPNID
jgi:hypothetical protein